MIKKSNRNIETPQPTQNEVQMEAQMQNFMNNSKEIDQIKVPLPIEGGSPTQLKNEVDILSPGSFEDEFGHGAENVQDRQVIDGQNGPILFYPED